MRSLAKITIVVFGLTAALTSRSAVIGYQITGTVNLVFGNPFNGIAPRLGDPVTGLFIYDTSVVPDLLPADLTLGHYIQNSPALLSYTLRGVKFESFGEFDLYVGNAARYDQIQVADYTPKFDGQLLADHTSHVELLLDNLARKHFVDDHLPVSLNLANFNSNQGEIAALSGGLFSGVTFSINSLTPVSVPEPAVGILGLAGLMLGCKRLVRRHEV